MSLYEKHSFRRVPRYYKTMYLDGFTPDDILFAARRDWRERREAQRRDASLQEQEDYSLTINSKVEVEND